MPSVSWFALQSIAGRRLADAARVEADDVEVLVERVPERARAAELQVVDRGAAGAAEVEEQHALPAAGRGHAGHGDVHLLAVRAVVVERQVGGGALGARRLRRQAAARERERLGRAAIGACRRDADEQGNERARGDEQPRAAHAESFIGDLL